MTTAGPEPLAMVWQAMADRWGAGGSVATGAPGRPDRAAARAAAIAAAAGAVGAPLDDVGHEPDGRPRWSNGWTGSVSHRADTTIALVRPAAAGAGIGVDVEEIGALPVAEAVLVLRPDELAHCRRAPDPAVAATLTWSVKEAAFKAWSAASGGLPDVDPLDIAVRWRDDQVVVDPVGTLTMRVGRAALIGDVRIGRRLSLTIVGAVEFRMRPLAASRRSPRAL